MSTSAGIYFKADKETIERMRDAIPALDAITNENGLGVSCTPTIGKCEGGYYLAGQTHWSYDGENGRALNAEIKKWIEANNFKVEIFDEYDA